MIDELYITGAGVSASSGIPTFRGNDGFWTVGSKNYTPQEMATKLKIAKSANNFKTLFFIFTLSFSFKWTPVLFR